VRKTKYQKRIFFEKTKKAFAFHFIEKVEVCYTPLKRFTSEENYYLAINPESEMCDLTQFVKDGNMA
jgi:hypothetical protein